MSKKNLARYLNQIRNSLSSSKSFTEIRLKKLQVHLTISSRKIRINQYLKSNLQLSLTRILSKVMNWKKEFC